MAQLDIDIVARLASFQDGLSKMQRDVDRAVGDMRASFASLGSFIGQTLSLGTIGAVFKAAVDDLAALDDAAEQTGSSVELLSASLNTLRNNDAGNLDDILGLTTRLGRVLQNVDKDTSKAADAFKRLGVNIEDLKAEGRVEGILRIARAQAQYADDAQKAIAIDAALGRGASELISKLNELAKTNISAATTTGAVASQAEQAGKQIAQLQNNLIALRNDIVTEILPSFNRMLINLRAFAELGSAPKDLLASIFGNEGDLAKQIADREANVARLRKLQDEALGQLNSLPDTPNALPARRNAQTRLASINRELEAEGLRINQLTALIRRRTDLEKQTSGSAVGAGSAGSVNTRGLTGGTKDQLSDGAKLLQQLEDRITATLDLTEVEKLSRDIILQRIQFDSQAQETAALAAAAKIDSIKAQFDAEKRIADVEKERIRLQQQSDDDYKRRTEAIRDQIQAWEDLADPTRRYQRELERINELLDADEISADQASRFRRAQIEGLVGSLEENRRKAEEVDNAARDLGLTFQSAFEDAVLEGEKLSKVLQSLAKDVARVFLRKTVTEPLIGAVTGGIQSLLGGGAGAVNGELNPYVGLSTATKASGSIPYVVNNVSVTGEVSKADVLNAVTAAERRTTDAILASMNRNGAFARA